MGKKPVSPTDKGDDTIDRRPADEETSPFGELRGLVDEDDIGTVRRRADEFRRSIEERFEDRGQLDEGWWILLPTAASPDRDGSR